MSARHFRPTGNRLVRYAVFTVAALGCAGLAVPALADTEPDVRLIVGLEAADKQATADHLGRRGYHLRQRGRLERLGARTLAVKEGDAAEVAAELRDQDGVAFVQIDRRVTALGESSDEESTATPTPDESSPTPTPSQTTPAAPATEPTTASSPTSSVNPDDPTSTPTTEAPTSTPTTEAPAGSPTPTPPAASPTALDKALAQIGVPAALAGTTTWTAQTVAVVDTGVTAVGSLSDSVLSGANTVDGAPSATDTHDDSTNSHGTSVASLVKAACPACKILPVKVLDKRNTGYESEAAEGITYAADQGARVINLSFGAPVQPNTPDVGALMQTAVNYARNKGAVVVASAGDDERGDLKYYPAASVGVIAVGGTNADGGRYTAADDPAGKIGSSHGPGWVDVAAPYCAGALTSTGATQSVCGTSYSAALVSGVGGLVKSGTAAANAWSIDQALSSTATPPAATDKWVSSGQIRADLAVAKVDTTAPKVGNTTPAYHQRFRGAFTVTANTITDTGGGYTGGSGADHAVLYAAGKLIGSDATAPFAVSYNPGAANATIRLEWKVYDRAGNVGSLLRDAIADNAGPTLTWVSGPANKATATGTVTVTAKASDASGVARIELWINGKKVQTDTTSGYSFKINTAKYGKSIKVQLRAVDKLGNVRASAIRTWKS